jgi:nitrite reductase (NADH) small subunit
LNLTTASWFKLVEVQGKKIALFNLDGKFHAIDNTCTHRGGPLSEGELEGDEVTCPWHGAKFKVSSGEVLSPPAPQGVGSYKVRVNGRTLSWNCRRSPSAYRLGAGSANSGSGLTRGETVVAGD